MAETKSDSLKAELKDELSSFVADKKIKSYSLHKKEKNPFSYEYHISLLTNKSSVKPFRIIIVKNYMSSSLLKDEKVDFNNFIQGYDKFVVDETTAK